MTDAAGRERPAIDALSILAYGSAGIDQSRVREALGLTPDSTDEQFARALVEQAAQASLPALHVTMSSAPPRQGRDSNRPPRPSVVPWMAATQGPLGATSRGLRELDNLHTLLLIARAGGLFLRRAAIVRIGDLLMGVEVIAADQRRQTLETLRRLGHAELAYDVGDVLASLSGGEGRSARAEQRARQDLAARVQLSVLAFWEGEHHAEPFAALNAEERAMLLPHARGLSDVTVRHLSSLLENTAARTAEPELRVLLTLLEHAGDPRLLPALRSLFFDTPTALYEPCVRALASIDDPRVPALFDDAYERATRTTQRLLLAAALGRFGDSRGLTYARNVLREQDPQHLVAAVGVLSEIGGKDDVQRLIDLLEHPDPRVLHSAIRGLARIGDSRALLPLAELRSRVESSSKRADIEDAESAISARAELLGEALPSGEALYESRDTRRMVAIARTRDPALLRLRARVFYGVAVMCSLCGAARRANSFFEAASALLPGWLAPVRALALLHARRRDIAAALAAFRRALDIDREELEADAHAVSVMATTFLRRAEAVEREGRVDIARGLVDEALSYDLRRAGAEVRMALSERRQTHLAEESV
ncbi:MAG TPA: HEAT repeat domain-containing protein [Polyangiales bacterium]|nr:HEAT repeat domain-containing protein [Polyangiales bacterium]